MEAMMQAHTSFRARFIWIALAIVAIALGLGSRKYGGALPPFLATYAGDTLWAMLVFALAGALAPRARLRTRAFCALTFAFAIEFSQLIKVEWLDAARQTRLGALVLGQGFLWSDLACYAVGIALGALGELLVSASRPRRPGS